MLLIAFDSLCIRVALTVMHLYRAYISFQQCSFKRLVCWSLSVVGNETLNIRKYGYCLYNTRVYVLVPLPVRVEASKKVNVLSKRRECTNKATQIYIQRRAECCTAPLR
jgi:hypothetical protein